MSVVVNTKTCFSAVNMLYDIPFSEISHCLPRHVAFYLPGNNKGFLTSSSRRFRRALRKARAVPAALAVLLGFGGLLRRGGVCLWRGCLQTWFYLVPGLLPLSFYQTCGSCGCLTDEILAFEVERKSRVSWQNRRYHVQKLDHVSNERRGTPKETPATSSQTLTLEIESNSSNF
ncbi:hypothetical protein B0H66DRAFT_631501 [Apodospora peruviana]|uniref:Uncharacterized protein n=1 Tax=Apodospora peruviana TaxID=516989 RepID=A0AAE0LYV4_9PEZI|nr:hypothetical protein B0H66DRAFT_631501 [Apodospora peruviana]